MGGLIILVLLVIGGIIAFIGDRIGMKVGKKRLTLFGIRPRYTSMIITIFTGIVIVAASVVILSIVSEDVRMALFHMEEIKEALATSESRYLESQRLLSEAEALLNEQQVRVELLRLEVEAKTEELSLVEKQRNDAMTELEAVRHEWTVAMEELEEVHNAYLEAKTALVNTEERLVFERERVETLKAASEMIQATLHELQQREAMLEARIVDLFEQYQALYDAYQRFSEQMRYGHFIFTTNEIVYAQVIEGGKGYDAAQQDLVEFLLNANKIALNRGARIEGKDDYALVLLSEEHFDQVVRILGNESGHYVVRAMSYGNTVMGEPLVIWFDLKPRQKVFDKGAVIASVTVTDAQNIEDIILALLRQVNELAIVKGMITDSEGRVGQTTGEEFFEAIAAVREAEGEVIVNAVARHETWNTGKLQIGFEVIVTEGTE